MSTSLQTVSFAVTWVYDDKVLDQSGAPGDVYMCHEDYEGKSFSSIWPPVGISLYWNILILSSTGVTGTFDR